jgi:hypothetical protein
MSVPGCLSGALTPFGRLCSFNLVPATVACVATWFDEFRKEIAHNELPPVNIHSDDGVLPADAMSR